MEKLDNLNNLSIIIPTLNEAKYLPDLLSSIKGQTYKDYEIIVSDAFSTDKTREIAKNSKAKVVNGGILSKGRNNGASVAKGGILVFMDADIKFNSQFLENSLKQFIKEELDIASPLFEKNLKKRLSNNVYKFSDFLKKITKDKKHILFSTCQCLFIKKSFFVKTGGFNEELHIGEDIAFLKEARKLKGKYSVLSTAFHASDRRFVKNRALSSFFCKRVGCFHYCN